MKTGTKRVLIAIGIAVALILVMGVVLRIMAGKGLVFVKMEWCAWLALLPMLILAGWGIYTVYKKIGQKVLQKLVTLVLILVLLVLIAVANTIITLSVGSKFGDVRSPGGREITILQGYYFNDSESEDFVGEGVVYIAYPKKFGLFVDMNAESEGEIIKSVDSMAKLMVEWPEENVAHLYLEDPEASDSGEITVKFPD